MRYLNEKFVSAGVPRPLVQVVLGSGFGEALRALPSDWNLVTEIAFKDVPGLAPSTVADHPGRYALYFHQAKKLSCLFQMGRLHGYEGHSPRTTVAPVMIPRICGIKNFILTNAAGGLSPKMKSGDIMIIKDHINMTGNNPLVGPNPRGSDGRELGPRFPDMSHLYDPQWIARLRPLMEKQNLQVHEGVYLGLLGPTYETHAEVRLFASWGAGTVGMSTVWEAIALRHSGARLAGVSMVSNLAAGMTDEKIEHADIMLSCRQSAGQILRALATFIETEVWT